MTEQDILKVFGKGATFCAYCDGNVDKKDLEEDAIAIASDTILCGPCVKETKKHLEGLTMMNHKTAKAS